MVSRIKHTHGNARPRREADGAGEVIVVQVIPVVRMQSRANYRSA